MLCAQEVTPEMTAFMKELRGKVTIGVVGGSDTNKIKEQLGEGCKWALTQATAPARQGLSLPFLRHLSAGALARFAGTLRVRSAQERARGAQASTSTTGSSRRMVWRHTRCVLAALACTAATDKAALTHICGVWRRHQR